MGAIQEVHRANDCWPSWFQSPRFVYALARCVWIAELAEWRAIDSACLAESVDTDRTTN